MPHELIGSQIPGQDVDNSGGQVSCFPHPTQRYVASSHTGPSTPGNTLAPGQNDICGPGASSFLEHSCLRPKDQTPAGQGGPDPTVTEAHCLLKACHLACWVHIPSHPLPIGHHTRHPTLDLQPDCLKRNPGQDTLWVASFKWYSGGPLFSQRSRDKCFPPLPPPDFSDHKDSLA